MTPHGEIRAAVVQGDFNVADRVREVETDETTLRVPGARDLRDVEPLAGQVLRARQQDRRDARTVALDRGDDVFRPQQRLARARRELDQVASGLPSWKRTCDSAACRSDGKAPCSIRSARRSPAGR
jgi:hypothetical protein